MKIKFLLLLALFPLVSFAQKDVSITRKNMGKEQGSFTMSPPFVVFDQETKVYLAFTHNGKQQRPVDLQEGVRRGAVLVDDSTKADRIIELCFANVSQPVVPGRYLQFDRKIQVSSTTSTTKKEYCMVFCPKIDVRVIVRDNRLGATKCFVLIDSLEVPFYCGIDKDGKAVLTTLSDLKEGNGVRGTSSPESFDTYLDREVSATLVRTELVSKVKAALLDQAKTGYTELTKTLYIPKTFAGTFTATYRMHVLGNKKAEATYPEIVALNNRAEELFVAWTKRQDDPELHTQLTQIAQQYVEWADKRLGKNFSLMCYSNAALALALTGDFAGSTDLLKKAEENAKIFGVPIGETIPEINKQYRLRHIVNTQEKIETRHL